MIKLSEIEEILLKDAYDTNLSKLDHCTCIHKYDGENNKLCDAKYAGLVNLVKLKFISIDVHTMGFTNYRILLNGINYIESK